MTPTPATSEPTTHIAKRILLSGKVQGVGIRPAIARLAVECGVAGTVSNRLEGVTIEVEGPVVNLDAFQRRLVGALPAATRLDDVRSEEIVPAERIGFRIEANDYRGPVVTLVPQDVVTCPECLEDVAQSGNRRHDYPFTTCTNCGPRYSLIEAMPFDRSRTRMTEFTLCAGCRAEYESPADRRFHAQTISCPECGPQIWAGERGGRLVARHREALQAAVECLRSGMIVALRGIGGYQLLCDATSEQAVARLRARKRRPSKPLAVMALDSGIAEKLAELDGTEQAALASPANPIVLVRARSQNGLAPGIHPGLSDIGLMAPTSPLHWLLLRECDFPLVVTSGNREGEPLAIDVDEAIDRLRDLADLWLHHNRSIARPVDDSVVRVIAGRTVTLRLGRGLAPLPLDLPTVIPAVAVGGQQKVAMALGNGSSAILGAHVGDVTSVRSRERFTTEVSRTLELYGATRPLWIHDLHPDYVTTQWAQDQTGARLAVQHHHAHIVATMIEQGWLDREVLGVAFDGTGFGANGTIWGGEFLLATATGFRRAGHLREFSLAGGTTAIREPWRVAVALVRQAGGTKALSKAFSEKLAERAQRLLPLLDRPQVSPRTTSAGRLFDGVAYLALEIERAEFEGYPAMRLEAMADRTDNKEYTFALDDGETLQIDWRPMITELLRDLRKGTPPGILSMRFHRGLARAVAVLCRKFSPRPVALGGGVFQNRLLTELILDALSDSGQTVGFSMRIPPNDGGLAAGQVAVGMAIHARRGG